MWVLHVTQTFHITSLQKQAGVHYNGHITVTLVCHLNPNYLSTSHHIFWETPGLKMEPLCSAPRERSLRNAATHRTLVPPKRSHLGKPGETCSCLKITRPHLLRLICWPSPLWPNKNSFNELTGLHCSPQLLWLERGSIKCLCCR